MFSVPAWLAIALVEYGTKEIRGGENKRILEYHSATTLKATEDEVPWCSSFVCWCLEQAGYASTKSAAAKSYVNYGGEGDYSLGDIVVLSRTGGNHVGFCIRRTLSSLQLLGGNQGDRVCITEYNASRIIACRRPE